MYKCEYCGLVFDEDKLVSVKESMGEYQGAPASQEFQYCPQCGQDCFEHITPCKVCGSYDHEVFESYCKECEADVIKRLEVLVAAEFSVKERELLKELYEANELEGCL
jgi:hypothetical protein